MARDCNRAIRLYRAMCQHETRGTGRPTFERSNTGEQMGETVRADRRADRPTENAPDGRQTRRTGTVANGRTGEATDRRGTAIDAVRQYVADTPEYLTPVQQHTNLLMHGLMAGSLVGRTDVPCELLLR